MQRHDQIRDGGPLVLVGYDKLMELSNFIQDPTWENVDAMIEGLVDSLDTPEAKVAERARLKQHAREVVQPGFDYFHDKFTGELAHELNLLRLARLCNG